MVEYLLTFPDETSPRGHSIGGLSIATHTRQNHRLTPANVSLTTADVDRCECVLAGANAPGVGVWRLVWVCDGWCECVMAGGVCDGWWSVWQLVWVCDCGVNVWRRLVECVTAGVSVWLWCECVTSAGGVCDGCLVCMSVWHCQYTEELSLYWSWTAMYVSWL